MPHGCATQELIRRLQGIEKTRVEPNRPMPLVCRFPHPICWSVRVESGCDANPTYQYGSVEQIPAAPIIYAVPPSWSDTGGNQSASKTSPRCQDNRDKLIVEYANWKAGYLPVCFASEFVPSSNKNPDPDFAYSTLNQDDIEYNDYPDWALLRSSMLSGLEYIVAGYGESISVTSGYRSPYVQHEIDTANIAAGKYKIPSPHSRHVHGDAVDIRARDQNTWNTFHYIVRDLDQQACIEPYHKAVDHFHVDWRPWSQCPPTWRK